MEYRTTHTGAGKIVMASNNFNIWFKGQHMQIYLTITLLTIAKELQLLRYIFLDCIAANEDEHTYIINSKNITCISAPCAMKCGIIFVVRRYQSQLHKGSTQSWYEDYMCSKTLWQSVKVIGPNWVMRKDVTSHAVITIRQVLHQQNQWVNTAKTATATPAFSYLISD
jgi:hypothetical protein